MNMRKFIRGFSLIEMILVIAFIAIAAVMVIGPAVARADDGTFTTIKHWAVKWEYHSGVAGEDITIGDAVAYHPYSGEVYKADADSSTARPCVGLAGNTASDGSSVQIVTKGIIRGMPCGLGTEASSAITPIGIPLFLAHDPAGGVTTIGGLAANSGISQFVATALPLSHLAEDSGVTTGTDTYFVNVAAPYLLSGTTPINSGVAKWE